MIDLLRVGWAYLAGQPERIVGLVFVMLLAVWAVCERHYLDELGRDLDDAGR